MSDFLGFVVAHWELFTGAAVAVGALVAAFVRWTPTKRDDEWLEDVQDDIRKMKGK